MTSNPLGKMGDRLGKRSVRQSGNSLAPLTPAVHAPAGIPGEGKVHGKRRRGSGALVQLTVRLPHSAWAQMNELKIKEGLSAQEQFTMGLGLLFAQYGLRPAAAAVPEPEPESAE